MNLQIGLFNGSFKIGTRWTIAGYQNGSPVKWQKSDVHRMSVTFNKWTNGKWTLWMEQKCFQKRYKIENLFNALLMLEIYPDLLLISFILRSDILATCCVPMASTIHLFLFNLSNTNSCIRYCLRLCLSVSNEIRFFIHSGTEWWRTGDKFRSH